MAHYTFTTINPDTKRAQGIIWAYKNSWRTTLEQAYTSHYSREKARAFKNCLCIMEAQKGHDMKITGKGTYSFSCACYGKNEKGEDGLIYFTSTRNYFIPLKAEMSIKEFEERWGKVSPNIKAHTANALKGRTVASMEEAEGILKLAEAFTAMERFIKR